MKVIKPFYLVLFFVLCFFSQATGQDKHFTQFYAVPLSLNPALTGLTDGTYRISAAYRDQWRVALQDPIAIYAAGGDVRFEFDPNKSGLPDYMGIGFQFFSDRVGNFDLNTDQLSLFIAYHKGIEKDFKQYLSLGFQVGLAQRSVNYENIFFGDQFNNIDSYSLPTDEALPPNIFGVADFSAGLNYTITPSNFFRLFAGTAVHHFSTPNIAFWKKSQSITPGLIKKDLYHIKYSGHLSADIDLTESISLLPRVLASFQGAHMEMNIGSNVRFKLNTFRTMAVHLGSWVRPVNNYDGIGLDAVVFMAGFEVSSLILGFSYDANLNDILTDREGLGAFEFTISYIGEHENENNFCPKF